LTYLHPPPGDAPVVVVKDVGGYVDEYGRQTAAYFASRREVRLHECRSACTLALALPNVCVYPSSVLKFHKAYNPITKQANEEVSAAMMAAYPPAVRERLGTLTRDYKALTGSELIRLGIRECDKPQSRVMIARAIPNLSPAENPISNAFGGLVAALTPQSAAPTSLTIKVASVRADRTDAAPQNVETGAISPAAFVPTPPRRAETAAPAREAKPDEMQAAKPDDVKVLAPDALDTANSGTAKAEPASAALIPAPPEPPQAPELSTAFDSNWGRPISGSAPVLFSARFAPFPYRLAGGG
jgi:hypothetical protein